MQRSDGFCRVNRRQNESDVLRGGKKLHGEQILAVLCFSERPRLRSNESPSGAFKRQSGLAQQDGGALPRQVLPQQDHLENSQEFEK